MKHRRMKGSATALVAVFVVAGILVAILGYRQYYRFSTSPAWVANGNLGVGDVITGAALKQIRTQVDGGVISNPRQLVGKQLTVAKSDGETFKSGDLASSPKSWLANELPVGRVLYTVSLKTPFPPATKLRKGDRLDVLATGQRVRMVARDVILMGMLSPNTGGKANKSGRGLLTALAEPPSTNKGKGGGGIPLVLAVRPDDVYALAGIRESEKSSVALHGTAEVRDGKLLNIKPNVTKRRVQVVNGLETKQVYVNLQ